MPVKKEFTKSLDNFGQEQLRIKLLIDKGKLSDIVFQYESFINGKWTEIVRYDCAHGFFHRDFIPPKGEKEKKRIEIDDLKMAANFAEQDILDKWEFYKSKFLQIIIDNPKLAESLPDKCEIEFIERDYSSHSEDDLLNKRLIKVQHNFELI
jgi:hypothetical protein